MHFNLWEISLYSFLLFAYGAGWSEVVRQIRTEKRIGTISGNTPQFWFYVEYVILWLCSPFVMFLSIAFFVTGNAIGFTEHAYRKMRK